MPTDHGRHCEENLQTYVHKCNVCLSLGQLIQKTSLSFPVVINTDFPNVSPVEEFDASHVKKIQPSSKQLISGMSSSLKINEQNAKQSTAEEKDVHLPIKERYVITCIYDFSS